MHRTIQATILPAAAAAAAAADAAIRRGGLPSVAIAELASLSDPEHRGAINRDVDDAL